MPSLNKSMRIIYGGRLPRDFCPSGAMHDLFSDGKSVRFFRAISANVPAFRVRLNKS